MDKGEVGGVRGTEGEQECSVQGWGGRTGVACWTRVNSIQWKKPLMIWELACQIHRHSLKPRAGREWGWRCFVGKGEGGSREKKCKHCSRSLLRAVGEENPVRLADSDSVAGGWMQPLCRPARGLATVSAFVPTELLISSANWAVNWSVVLIKYLPTLLCSRSLVSEMCSNFSRAPWCLHPQAIWSSIFPPLLYLCMFSPLEIWMSLLCDNGQALGLYLMFRALAEVIRTLLIE